MDKELTEITPTNLDGTEVSTIKRASDEDAKVAAAAEKEEKENYYVDPLEQDAIMKEKLEKIQAEKARQQKENYGDDDNINIEVDESIRPDMNVTGYFSSGNTAAKQNFMNRPASVGSLNLIMILGIIGAIYSAFYFIVLLTDNFSSPNWFMGWLYAIVVIASIFSIITGIRSLKLQKDNLKRKALIGIIGSCISFLPLLAWIVHWISQLF